MDLTWKQSFLILFLYMCQFSQANDNEFVIGKSSEFCFENQPNASSSFLGSCELQMADDRAEPFISLTTK